jgi:hypothetical protein
MSGDAELPPTYYFSGITFNPDFYQTASGDYLTFETAKKSFLTYPTAQGSETNTTLNSSSINTSILSSTDLITSNGISNTGTITSSGLITANNGLTVPSGKAMTASGTLVASIGTISGNTAVLSYSANNTPSLVGGSYNINLFVILAGNNSKTVTLMDPIANQNITFRARMTGGTSITIQANNSASIIYAIDRATLSSSVVFTSITSSLKLISDGTYWYQY